MERNFDDDASSGIVTFPKNARAINTLQESDFDRLRGVPAFENYIKKVVVHEIRSELGGKNTPKRKETKQQEQKDKSSPNEVRGRSRAIVIKSPSDTTIYSPALRNIGMHNGIGGLTQDSPIRQILGNQVEDSEKIERMQEIGDVETTNPVKQQEPDMLDPKQDNDGITEKIIRFIEGI